MNKLYKSGYEQQKSVETLFEVMSDVRSLHSYVLTAFGILSAF